MEFASVINKGMEASAPLNPKFSFSFSTHTFPSPVSCHNDSRYVLFFQITFIMNNVIALIKKTKPMLIKKPDRLV